MFIDELDALGGSRHHMHQHHNRMLVNQLLIELDGLQSFNHEVLVVGATNTPGTSIRRCGSRDSSTICSLSRRPNRRKEN